MAAAREISVDAAIPAIYLFCVERKTKNGAEGFSQWKSWFYFNPNCLWQEFTSALWRTVAHHRDGMHFAPTGSRVLLPELLWFVHFGCDKSISFSFIYLFIYLQMSSMGSSPHGHVKHASSIWQRTSLNMRDTGLVCTHLQTEARRFTCVYSRTLTHAESAWLQSAAPRAGLLINGGERKERKGRTKQRC